RDLVASHDSIADAARGDRVLGDRDVPPGRREPAGIPRGRPAPRRPGGSRPVSSRHRSTRPPRRLLIGGVAVFERAMGASVLVSARARLGAPLLDGGAIGATVGRRVLGWAAEDEPRSKKASRQPNSRAS